MKREDRNYLKIEQLRNDILSAKDPLAVIYNTMTRDLDYIGNDILTLKVPGYENLLDYILKKRVNIPKTDFRQGSKLTKDLIKTLIHNNKIDYIIDNLINCPKPYYFDEELLSISISNKMFIEKILSRYPYDLKIDGKITNMNIINYLIDNNHIKYLSTVNLDLLLSSKKNNMTLFEYILKNKNTIDYTPNIKYLKFNNDNFINVPKPSNNLLHMINNKPVLEYLLEKEPQNIKIDFNIIPTKLEQNNIINIFTYLDKNNKLYLIEDISNEVLLLKYYSTTTILEELLKVELIKIDKNKIDFLLKNNYHNLLLKISSKDDLLKKYQDKELIVLIIEDLFYKGKNINQINNILRQHKNTILNKEIARILLQYNIVLPVKETEIVKEKTVVLPNINPELKPYIDKLIKIMNTGKTSNKKLLDLLVKSLNEQYKINKELTIRDIKLLIDIKYKDSNFNLLLDPNGSSNFDPKTSTITLNILSSLILNHEITHAIHHYYCDSAMHDIFYNLIDTNQSEELINNLFNIIKERIKEEIKDDRYYKRLFINYINANKGSLSEYKEEIRKDFKRIFGRVELSLEKILKNTNSKNIILAIKKDLLERESYDNLIEEYINQRLKEEYFRFKAQTIIRNKEELLMFENFIDAFTLGKINSKIYFEGFDVPSSTHTEEYFKSNPEIAFQELLADYIGLKKSPKGKKYISILEKLFTENFIDLLDDFYLQIDKKIELKYRI